MKIPPIDLYIYSWFIFFSIVVVTIVFKVFRGIKNDRGFLQKFINDIDKSFYNENSSFNDIVIFNISGLGLIAFLFSILQYSYDFISTLTLSAKYIAALIIPLVQLIIAITLWYTVVVIYGKAATIMGKRNISGKISTLILLASFAILLPSILFIS